jgi:hypothetical protein
MIDPIEDDLDDTGDVGESGPRWSDCSLPPRRLCSDPVMECLKERVHDLGGQLGRRPVSADIVERIREQLATGAGILKTAKALGVGTGTVHRVKREMVVATLQPI